MAESDDALQRQLRALRSEYLADSSQRVEELRRIHGRLAAGEPAALSELRQAFHRLAGSGGSYGFPRVSTSSREGERLAQDLAAGAAPPGPAELAALASCIGRVHDAFADARRALDAAPPGASSTS